MPTQVKRTIGLEFSIFTLLNKRRKSLSKRLKGRKVTWAEFLLTMNDDAKVITSLKSSNNELKTENKLLKKKIETLNENK